ncbi:monovalent cation/H(+) antiporter subunit G [Actinomadura atramentaria]|uniref:monovalent cation/H(+) antiporter subunit G n=1 Tax=Actinomadura atramentaria TaxID=1990 RepID=UPI000373DD80|nr:monovalent cation/H(+) antiporter subunit G [Actinomadura atramentaria]
MTGLVLVWAGVAVAVAAALRVAFAARLHARLHLSGPAAVLAAPLVTAGLLLAPAARTSGHDAAKIAIIGALVMLGGPACVVATARAAHPRRLAARDREGGRDG